MNLRGNKRTRPDADVMLSPLIDCVFLLLIFFLVTSMIKRYERQIPVTLADDTSAITSEPFDDSYPIGVDPFGELFAPNTKNQVGVMEFSPISAADSGNWLAGLLAERGGKRPVTVVVQRGTPFQRVIDVQDRLELTGFETIRFRIRDFPLDETGEPSRGYGGYK